jgi:hypothetical protein
VRVATPIAAMMYCMVLPGGLTNRRRRGERGEQRTDLGLAEPPVPPRGPDRADPAGRSPPGDRFGVYPEQRGNLSWREQTFSVLWLGHRGLPKLVDLTVRTYRSIVTGCAPGTRTVLER